MNTALLASKTDLGALTFAGAAVINILLMLLTVKLIRWHRSRQGGPLPRPETASQLQAGAPVPQVSAARPVMKASFCPKCGAHQESDAAFCKYCGQRLNAPAAAAPRFELKEKVFNWGFFTGNRSAVADVNYWLAGRRLTVKGMSALARHATLHSVLNHLELRYYDDPSGSIYQMGCFERSNWISMDYSALDEDLEYWKRCNPDKTVVMKTYCGHQYNGGSSRTLFFLYCINGA